MRSGAPRRATQRAATPAPRRSRLSRIAPAAWLYVVGALVLGYAIPRLRFGELGYVNPRLPKDVVVAFLSSVSSGMMAFTGIVFSLLFILLQFASTAYSPHIVGMLTQNRVLAHAGGVFTGTFLYSLMALRGAGTVPGTTTELTILVAFAWLLASIYLLLRLVGVFSSLAVSNILEMLGDEGHTEITRVYRPYSAEAAAEARELRARAPTDTPPAQTLERRGRPAYLVAVDEAVVVELARAAGAVVFVPVAIGDSVTEGLPLAYVWGERPVPEDDLRAAFRFANDRTNERGPKNALRLLVDVAIRALSPAINDPTTAVHALDQIESLLVRLGRSHLDVGVARDGAGTVRLVHDAFSSWEDYLALGLTEIQQYGAGAVQVERRLAALLDLLERAVPAPRKPAVRAVAAAHTALIRESFKVMQRAEAERVDRQGLGHPVRP